MTFRNRLLTSFLAPFILGAVTCQATEADENRVAVAMQRFQEFLAAGKELQEDEYFLFSLQRSIRPEELDSKAELFGMRVRGVHFCTRQGVLVVTVKATETASARVARLNFPEAIGIQANQLSLEKYGNDLVPSAEKICGFEAILTATDASNYWIHESEQIAAIEVGNKRRRHLAVNYLRRGSQAK